MWIALGALNAFIAVAAGAFAAHGLKERLSAELLTIFETGARYHMYHALGLLAVGVLSRVHPPRLRSGLLAGVGICFLAGILLFSGSLYALALSGVRALGAITPIGGVAFLVGWGMLATYGLRATNRTERGTIST